MGATTLADNNHSNQHSNHQDHHHDHHRDMEDSKDVFGFWLYIMTDCILFACLFAVFLVLNKPNAFSPPLKDMINLKYVLGETAFLLASNFTFGMGIINMYKSRAVRLKFWLLMTFILGSCFVFMEVKEFIMLAHEGHAWYTSGALSSFFALVGTHGLHVSVGLIWILIMIIQVAFFKINPVTKKRLIYLGLFWNFLEIVWIFVFSVVYLIGAM